jgi:DNA-binding NarL/FixJ family response regulator
MKSPKTLTLGQELDRALARVKAAEIEFTAANINLKRVRQLVVQSGVLGDRAKLTQRETQVLLGLVDFLQNKEIASKLNISERTVKSHVAALLRKMKCTDRNQLRQMVGHENYTGSSGNDGVVPIRKPGAAVA